jgi:hypothetical protein
MEALIVAGDAKGIAVAEVRGVMLSDSHELATFGYIQRAV